MKSTERLICCPGCNSEYPLSLASFIRYVPSYDNDIELARRGGLEVSVDISSTLKVPSHPGISKENLCISAGMARAGIMEPLFSYWSKNYTGSRTFVWGAGNPESAKVLFIGEAPGAVEESIGVPFSGPAGVYLSAALESAKINRMNDAFIINTTCVAPNVVGGRIGKPDTNIMLSERPRVMSVIDALASRPQGLDAIICLGKYAWYQLAKLTDLQQASQKGREVSLNSFLISRYIGWHAGVFERAIPVMLLYHPSYIMRNCQNDADPVGKKKVLADYLACFLDLRKKI